MNWLGDLPNAGYSSPKQKALSDAIMVSIRGWERERHVLLMMVIEGEELFRARCRKGWAAWRPDEDLLREVWAYVKRLAGPNPQQQLANLLTIRPYASKLTPEQIKAIETAAGQ